ncbi:MAG: hypothetical protein HLUCCA12_15655 [Rhodobacteraceae bacterium HLUCCA12]|nr:MAG: hypothetical protein HLUCCA12_15655 [Rhodobacteraceae bacterium HLUCCA12]
MRTNPPPGGASFGHGPGVAVARPSGRMTLHAFKAPLSPAPGNGGDPQPAEFISAVLLTRF